MTSTRAAPTRRGTTMTEQEARQLTEDIRQAAGRLDDLLKRAYAEGAWQALGYESWTTYIDREFKDQGRQWRYAWRAYGEVADAGVRGPDGQPVGADQARRMRPRLSVVGGNGARVDRAPSRRRYARTDDSTMNRIQSMMRLSPRDIATRVVTIDREYARELLRVLSEELGDQPARPAIALRRPEGISEDGTVLAPFIHSTLGILAMHGRWELPDNPNQARTISDMIPRTVELLTEYAKRLKPIYRGEGDQQDKQA